MDSTPWKIEWSDSLSMSNPDIDDEHREFIALVNEFNEAASHRRKKKEIESILDRILEHSITHFANEERLFAKNKYPKAMEHMKTHSQLVITLRNILMEIHDSEHSREWIEKGLAIKSALIKHILEVDSQYIEYLKEK